MFSSNRTIVLDNNDIERLFNKVLDAVESMSGKDIEYAYVDLNNNILPIDYSRLRDSGMLGYGLLANVDLSFENCQGLTHSLFIYRLLNKLEYVIKHLDSSLEFRIYDTPMVNISGYDNVIFLNKDEHQLIFNRLWNIFHQTFDRFMEEDKFYNMTISLNSQADVNAWLFFKDFSQYNGQ